MENNRSAEPVYDLITCQRSKVQGEGKYARRFRLKQQPVHRMEAGRMEGGWGTCGMKLSAGCCCTSVLPAGSAGCYLCGYVKRNTAQQPLCHLLEHVMRRLWSSWWSQTLAAGIWHRCSCSECADEARPLSGFFFCRVSFNKSELISHRGRRPCTSPVPDTHRYSLCRLQDPVTGCRVCVHP